MLGKTNNTEADKSVISSDMKIKGKISADGELVLLGSVVGDIKCHSLSVEGTGNLKGTIETDNADVCGKVDGNVKISGTLTIQEQGSVAGTIEYQNLQIKLGGKINGDIKVSEKVKKITDAPKKEESIIKNDLKDNKA